MDIIQIVLAAAVFVLTTILALVGVAVFLILKEARESVKKINKILTDAGLISESITKPITSVSGIFEGVKNLTGLIKTWARNEEAKHLPSLQEGFDNGVEPVRDGDEKAQAVKIEESSPRFRHFFTRAGKRIS